MPPCRKLDFETAVLPALPPIAASFQSLSMDFLCAKEAGDPVQKVGSTAIRGGHFVKLFTSFDPYFSPPSNKTQSENTSRFFFFVSIICYYGTSPSKRHQNPFATHESPGSTTFIGEF